MGTALRVYALTQGYKGVGTSDMVSGQLPVANNSTYVLMDTGTSHSSIAASYVDKIDRKPKHVSNVCGVSLPLKEDIIVRSWVKVVLVWVEGRELTVDLLVLYLHEYNVILGMDWLTKYGAVVNFKRRKVTFNPPGQEPFVFQGTACEKIFAIISTLRARKLLDDGCISYLANVIENDRVEKLQMTKFLYSFQPKGPSTSQPTTTSSTPNQPLTRRHRLTGSHPPAERFRLCSQKLATPHEESKGKKGVLLGVRFKKNGCGLSEEKKKPPRTGHSKRLFGIKLLISDFCFRKQSKVQIDHLRLLDDILHTNGLDHLYAFQHPGEVSVGHENKRAQALKDRFIQMGEKQFLICPWNNNAFTLYDTEKGKRVVSLKYYSPKCRQQPKTTECGIYCMKYARDLISQRRTRAYLSNNFNSDLPYTDAELNEVQEEWAKYILPQLAK
ncbi:uncharacterized protein LOC133825154 [Humulus lupulus]|uniref:uncharacterized protein LOC133825154 n=1 Tax=Humulus lupulus TaxID=3486 RepID=UPI002B40C48D|nr:uncharacterized protein LOC133825154 [Humulus lupulus]